MYWPSILRQGLTPALATGIIVASIITAVTTKSQIAPASKALSASSSTEHHQLWDAAGAAPLALPVSEQFLHETGDITGGAWAETRAEPAVVGQVYGKLIVTREFGPSDEADADDILLDPANHLVAVSIGFKPFAGQAKDWFWARFTPNGELIDETGIMPSQQQLASIAAAHCSSPLPEEIAARS